nr:PREDICTED: uncharacterized protein LOC109036996 [Bemisia tabaci]
MQVTIKELLLCEEEMHESSSGEGSRGGENSAGHLSDPFSGAEGAAGSGLDGDSQHTNTDGRRRGFQSGQEERNVTQQGEDERMAVDGDESGVLQWMRFGASPSDLGSDDEGTDEPGYGCAELGNSGVRYVETLYESFGRSGKEVVDLWRTGYGGAHGRRYVIHYIFRLGAAHRDPAVISKQLARLSTGTFIVSVHGCHLHFVHACRFSNSTCRCYITKHLRGRFGRWVARRNRKECEYSEAWWSYLAVYLCSGGRRAAKVSVEGRNWAYHRTTGNLPVRKNRPAEAVQLVGRRGMADAVPPRSPGSGPSSAEGDLRTENKSPNLT